MKALKGSGEKSRGVQGRMYNRNETRWFIRSLDALYDCVKSWLKFFIINLIVPSASAICLEGDCLQIRAKRNFIEFDISTSKSYGLVIGCRLVL